MNNQIIVTWYNGKGIFYLPEFFPCTQMKLKKFVKLMGIDPMTKDDNINACMDYLIDRIKELTDEIQEISRQYKNARTEKSGLEDVIKSKKRPNGVPLRKEEIEKLKRRLYSVNRKVKELANEFNSEKRTRNRLMKKLELLKKLCDAV